MKTVKCPCNPCVSVIANCHAADDLTCIVVWVMVPAPSLSKPSKPFFRESTWTALPANNNNNNNMMMRRAGLSMST